ncbi:MAG TPA: UDP-N-acetylmuramoyl-L-alanine--D-glutamate ligase, partial [Rhodospirillaceae bacterium]|nr:UDP-N-acetylmuramoyl-L-alanine--D-glutamate ligase [Rhodospirillaceae bacterium]
GYVAAKKRLAQRGQPQTIVIGTDEPETQALFGELLATPNMTLFEVSVQHQVIQGVRAENQKLHASFEPQPVDIAKIQTLPGKHNAQNAAAAFAACHALGLNRAEIEAGLQSFTGLAHRQQLVASLGGVRFVNDSKATNADAAAKALVCYDNIYWIIGGRAKAGGLNGLERFTAPVRHAFIIGECSDDFAAWCKGKIPFTCCGTLDVAVEKAAAMAWEDGQKDSCVLLSPATASFDQYARFEERGEHFARLVQDLTPPKAN